MATITFPQQLNNQLQSGFSRSTSEGFTTSDPVSGPAFYVIETEDLVKTYNISFLFSKSEAQQFSQWLELNNSVLFGDLFNMEMYNEDGFSMKEVRFTQGGTPQLSSVIALNYQYSAQVEVRSSQPAPTITNSVIINNAIVS